MRSVISPGIHLLLDFYGAKNLQDKQGINNVLHDAATACGATVLQIILHFFGEEACCTPNLEYGVEGLLYDGSGKQAGITGVAILAESHISIHTWPETGYAALDIFVCGNCNAHKAVRVLQDFFCPERMVIVEQMRGNESDKKYDTTMTVKQVDTTDTAG